MGNSKGIGYQPHSAVPSNFSVVVTQSINIRLLRHDKMQADNSKRKGNTVSKKKSMSR